MRRDLRPDPPQLVIAFSPLLLTAYCCQISGELVDTHSSLCGPTSVLPPTNLSPRLALALVFRGGCKFATKAENAVRAGWDGLVILDSENNTRVSKISGLRERSSQAVENPPVIMT